MVGVTRRAISSTAAAQHKEGRERYVYSPPLKTCGFFEDFFDTQPETVATFWQVVHQRLATAT
jgi:hypothetical protein